MNADFYKEDDARNFGRTTGIGQHAIVLRMSATVKDPSLGFTFGRSPNACDICFANDSGRRLSKIHFRIFLNDNHVLMVEDMSTNGTVVDDYLLRKTVPRKGTQRLVESGSIVKVVMAHDTEDLTFIVRIPRREDDIEMAYIHNVNRYLAKARGFDEDPNKTIGPGPSGHVSYGHMFELSYDDTNGQKVNLFPVPFTKGKASEHSSSYTALGKTPREFRGSQKYARVDVVGRGAFATVYKVTSKYDGSPYAAKELDKRDFMKNGIVDQKVENEMKIMQKVKHVSSC